MAGAVNRLLHLHLAVCLAAHPPPLVYNWASHPQGILTQPTPSQNLRQSSFSLACLSILVSNYQLSTVPPVLRVESTHLINHIESEIKVLVAPSCATLCNPMDCSPLDFSVHGILQARILGWVAIPFSRGIFPAQGLNLGLLCCRQILYHLSSQVLELNHIRVTYYLLIEWEKGGSYLNQTKVPSCEIPTCSVHTKAHPLSPVLHLLGEDAWWIWINWVSQQMNEWMSGWVPLCKPASSWWMDYKLPCCCSMTLIADHF